MPGQVLEVVIGWFQPDQNQVGLGLVDGLINGLTQLLEACFEYIDLKGGCHALSQRIVDHHQVEELVTINGDLGRLGGLLKLWLSNGKPAPGIDARTIRETLRKIDRAQEQMLALMQRVIRPQAEPLTRSRTSAQKDPAP